MTICHEKIYYFIPKKKCHGKKYPKTQLVKRDSSTLIKASFLKESWKRVELVLGLRTLKALFFHLPLAIFLQQVKVGMTKQPVTIFFKKAKTPWLEPPITGYKYFPTIQRLSTMTNWVFRYFFPWHIVIDKDFFFFFF